MSRFHAFTVVHRVDGADRVLGEVPHDFRSVRALDPFISALLTKGVTSGTVLLLDHASGQEIYERPLTPILCNQPTKDPR